jgi:hypothetical protein
MRNLNLTMHALSWVMAWSFLSSRQQTLPPLWDLPFALVAVVVVVVVVGSVWVRQCARLVRQMLPYRWGGYYRGSTSQTSHVDLAVVGSLDESLADHFLVKLILSPETWVTVIAAPWSPLAVRRIMIIRLASAAVQWSVLVGVLDLDLRR